MIRTDVLAANRIRGNYSSVLPYFMEIWQRIIIVFRFQHFFFVYWICYQIFAKGAVLRTDPTPSGFRWSQNIHQNSYKKFQNTKKTLETSREISWNFAINFTKFQLKFQHTFHVQFRNTSFASSAKRRTPRKASSSVAGAASRRRQNPFPAAGKTHAFFKILGETPKKILKISVVPLSSRS